MNIRRALVAASAALTIATLAPVAAFAAAPTTASVPSVVRPAVTKYPNCAALNRKYPHGVGRKGAVDHVRGKTRPVRNFTVNTAVYNANTARDGDKDGVACEKA